MKRKSSYTGDEKRAAKRVFQAHRQHRYSATAQVAPSHVLASAAAGGASRSTIYRWSHDNLSEEAIKERLSNRGRPRKFSDEMDQLIVGFFIDLRLNFQASTGERLVSFAHEYLGIKVSPQYISRLIKKHDITSQTSKKRNTRMTSEEVVKDVIANILAIREYNFEPDCIICFDETGLWSNVVQPRTYHFKNWCARL
jgi:transposase